jgi:hypothetical protein
MKRKKLLPFVLSLSLLALSAAPVLVKAAGAPQDDVDLAQGKGYQVTSTIVDTTFHAMETKNFPDDGTKLTDGIVGPGKWSANGPWVGFIRQDNRQIVVNLGDEQTIHKLDAWFLQDKAAGIYFPLEVSFEISNNGVNWSKLGTVATKTPLSDSGVLVQDYSLIDLNFTAKYVRYTFHADIWSFISEVQAWGLSGKQPGAHSPIPTPPEKPDPKGYPKAGSKQAGGKKYQVLIPNYYPGQTIGVWKPQDFIPYVAYVDQNQQIKDYLFDSFQFDPYGQANIKTKADWQTYLDQLFGADLQLGALNQAVATVNQAMNHKAEDKNDEINHKVKVVIGIPYPELISNWGDGLDFNPVNVGQDQSFVNRLTAMQWYINYVKSKWEAAGYKNLELNGFYWINENVAYPNTPNEEKLIQETGKIVHGAGKYTFDWIPFVQASGFQKWKSLGFDTAQMQPNYAFDASFPKDRLENNAFLAQLYGLGVEMEMHWNITQTDSVGQTYRDNYYDYLDAAVKYHYQDSFTTWYQNTDTLKVSALSTVPEIRQIYDLTYRFIKGKYMTTDHPVHP